jgi:hypothetical protein
VSADHIVHRARSVRCLTSLSRAPQDFDHCPCRRAPELQFVGRLTALNSVFNIIKVLPNNVNRPVTMPVDQASSGDPGDPVHDEKVRAESLRQVKLTMMHSEHRESRSSASGACATGALAGPTTAPWIA